MPEPRVQTGEFRHRIRVERAEEKLSSAGEPTLTWKTLRETWGRVRPGGGRDFFQAQQVRTTLTHTVELRYDRGFTLRPSDRIIYRDRIFNIVSVINVDERDVVWRTMCEECA